MVDGARVARMTCGYSVRMRFDRMFEDLEGQMDHLEDEQRRATTEDLTRAERAQIPLSDRLRDQGTRPLVVHLRAGLVVQGVLDGIGQDWIRLLATRGGEQIWLPSSALVALEGLSARARPHEDSPLRPASFAHELRALARDRTPVRVETEIGEIAGTIATVGSDVLDMVPAPERSTPLRRSGRTTILCAAVLAVRAARS